MQVASVHFKRNVKQELDNPVLQDSLSRFKQNFVPRRARAVADIPEFEAMRHAGAMIRDRALQDLDLWLELFEKQAVARGATVYWAERPEDVNRIVLEIAACHHVRSIVKSKSMVSEESHLDQALEATGLRVLETDLGEYILQLNDYEPPSHLVTPVFHKSKDEISDLFARKHGTTRKTDAGELTREARQVMRQRFLQAEMGISGGNFLIAETGSVMLVTNEGNATLGVSLPKIHIAITGIEKVVPTLEDAATLMRLLPRSALGQPIVNYVDLMTGIKAAHEGHGVEHMYYILVDSGRASMLGGKMRDALRCIRCGACMNHCPVYQTVGGHSYGWVYPGPIGAVLTPALNGLENALDLPHAATLCNQCGVVCPVKIPLADLQRTLREQQTERGLRPWKERLALRVWAWVALHPTIYQWATAVGMRVLHYWGGRDGLIHWLPFGAGGGWTFGRDMPAPRKHTFKTLYRRQQKHQRQHSAKEKA